MCGFNYVLKDLAHAIHPVIHWLWAVKVHHRDISVGNMMFRRLPCGRVQGVLNDYDLAKVASVPEEDSNRTRTGTKPFMAIDALAPDCAEYVERFDWEAFMWTLFWILCRYVPGTTEQNSTLLRDWLSASAESVKSTKELLLYKWGGKERSKKTRLHRDTVQGFYLNVYDEWLIPLMDALRDAQGEKLDKDVGALLQKQLTYELLWTILLEGARKVIPIEF